ncbi:DMT family transporter [Rhodanobacter sp. Col0626]|uniref:DMT family transporter n=1 Tax=Rhodanobacter sp. Col0626 TaxID=3415679 RepID=UPI003CF39643
MNGQARGTAEMAAAMTLAGTIGWFVVVCGRPVLEVVFWRCLFGAGTLLAVCAAMGVLRNHLTRRVLLLSVLGGVAIVLNWLLLFGAYARTSISIATAVYNTQPFILVCLGALFLGERHTLDRFAWLALAFGGLLLIVQVGPGMGMPGHAYLIGVAMAFAAALCWAIAALVTKRLAGTPPHLIALIQVCVGVLMLAPFTDFSHPSAQLSTWGLLVVLGVVHTGLVYVLMYDAIHRLPTHLQGALSFLYPVVAIAVDVLAFGRRFEPGQMLGAGAILVAVAGMNGQGVWRRARKALSPARDA